MYRGIIFAALPTTRPTTKRPTVILGHGERCSLDDGPDSEQEEPEVYPELAAVFVGRQSCDYSANKSAFGRDRGD
jgi:hypothetical protein